MCEGGIEGLKTWAVRERDYGMPCRAAVAMTHSAASQIVPGFGHACLGSSGLRLQGSKAGLLRLLQLVFSFVSSSLCVLSGPQFLALRMKTALR